MYISTKVRRKKQEIEQKSAMLTGEGGDSPLENLSTDGNGLKQQKEQQTPALQLIYVKKNYN